VETLVDLELDIPRASQFVCTFLLSSIRYGAIPLSNAFNEITLPIVGDPKSGEEVIVKTVSVIEYLLQQLLHEMVSV
jgi:hypothetical protein